MLRLGPDIFALAYLMYFKRDAMLIDFENILHIVKTVYLKRGAGVVLRRRVYWRDSFVLEGNNN